MFRYYHKNGNQCNVSGIRVPPKEAGGYVCKDPVDKLQVFVAEGILVREEFSEQATPVEPVIVAESIPDDVIADTAESIRKERDTEIVQEVVDGLVDEPPEVDSDPIAELDAIDEVLDKIPDAGPKVSDGIEIPEFAPYPETTLRELPMQDLREIASRHGVKGRGEDVIIERLRVKGLLIDSSD